VFLTFAVFLRIFGVLLEHDITNDYLNTCSSSDIYMSNLNIEQAYIIGRIIEGSFHFMSALVVCPILIYHLYKYHPEEFNNHGIMFIIYGLAIAIVKIVSVMNDDILY